MPAQKDGGYGSRESILRGGPASELLFPLQFNAAGVSYLTFFILMLGLGIIVWSVGFLWIWPRAQISQTLKWLGVAIARISRTVKELERKTLHLSGTLLPFCYHLFLTYIRGFTQYHCAVIVTAGWLLWCMLDVLRINVPFIRQNFPLTHLAREHELTHLSGVTYFTTGCWIAVVWFPPRIAITAMLFIIFGDMSAAIFGISFGRVKIYGNKSLEGTLAMFSVCTLIGLNMFWNIHMREYPVILAALAASLSELYEPFGINDNLTISLFSCLALQFGFYRISTCDPNWSVSYLLEPGVVDRVIHD